MSHIRPLKLDAEAITFILTTTSVEVHLIYYILLFVEIAKLPPTSQLVKYTPPL